MADLAGLVVGVSLFISVLCFASFFRSIGLGAEAGAVIAITALLGLPLMICVALHFEKG